MIMRFVTTQDDSTLAIESEWRPKVRFKIGNSQIDAMIVRASEQDSGALALVLLTMCCYEHNNTSTRPQLLHPIFFELVEDNIASSELSDLNSCHKHSRSRLARRSWKASIT